MLTRLSLRLRIFLFFSLLAVGGALLAGAALAFGWSRSETELPTTPFVTAFILFAFLNTGLALGIWLLFDEHVAKPINALSAGMRLRAHSGVDSGVSAQNARYLGDLGAAAEALSLTAGTSVTETAARIARETNRLKAETERLTAVLTEAPVATILLNATLEIVLYDTQAAEVLSKAAVPRLRAHIGDYFDMPTLSRAIERLGDAGNELPVTLMDKTGAHPFDARLKALSNDGYIIFIDENATQPQPIKARPLVFDFGLMAKTETRHLHDTDLSQLCFVPFDTETTGLSVETDAIVQLGAVRMLNGRCVEGEVLDMYVNPGRPIPPGSTKIHHVTDADVADAPDINEVGRVFHQFARDAVLVAHNAPFDIGIMQRQTSHCGLEWNHPVLDTVLLSAVVFGTTEDHSLDSLCERLSVTIDPDLRHTALGDAVATADATAKLLRLLKGKGIETFGQLVEETQKHGRLLRDLNA